MVASEPVDNITGLMSLIDPPPISCFMIGDAALLNTRGFPNKNRESARAKPPTRHSPSGRPTRHDLLVWVQAAP